MDAKQFNAGTITVQFSTSPHNSSYGCECTTPTAGHPYKQGEYSAIDAAITLHLPCLPSEARRNVHVFEVTLTSWK